MKWVLGWWRRRGWTVTVEYEDGSSTRYRFGGKGEAAQFAVMASSVPVVTRVTWEQGRSK